MTKLTKQQQQRLILTGLTTAMAIAGLWFALINAQKANLRSLQNDRTAAEEKLRQVEKTIQGADGVEHELSEARTKLTSLEEGIATGDPYIWMIETIRQFKVSHPVEIRQFSSIVISSNTLLPRFPYRQATISITGSGYFHDIGRFVSDLENTYPLIRVQNLLIEQQVQGVDDREKLFFKVDVVALLKTGPA